MVDGRKIYLGTVDNIMVAAILYDIVTIQNKGIKARTNFYYTKKEVIAVLFLKNLLSERVKQVDDDKLKKS